MTVSTTASRISYNGNGSTTIFSFPYKFLSEDDVIVILVAADGTETTQTISAEYTLSGVGDDAGGTVTMLTAPAAGKRLVIYREMALTQNVDYISGDAFPAETHEGALDRITLIAQQQQDAIDRSVKLSVTSTGDTTDLADNLETMAQRTDEIDAIALDLTGGTFDPSQSYDLGEVTEATAGLTGAPDGFIVTVYNNLTDIQTVADDIADVSTVAADIADVTTVATDIADVSAVADDLGGSDNIGTVAANIADVSAVAAIDADVTTVAGIGADLATVAGIDTDISTVAGISADITSVAGLSADLSTVAGDSANIGTVSGISSDVTAVSGISSDVTAVSGISADVITVAGDSANIGTVAGISSDISTVSGVSSAVSTVSGISADVSTVAGDSSNIGTVSTNIADVSSVATALTGDPSGGSLVSYSNSTSGLTATNTQEALDEIVGFVPNVNTANTFTGTQTFEGDVEINGTVDAGGLS